MPKYEYKVVRTYGGGSDIGSNRLTEAFSKGWEFVRASDYVPDYISRDLTHYFGFIEYILRREIKVEE